MDVLLALGWTVALLMVVWRRPEMDEVEKQAWQITILANAPLVLSPFASILMSDGTNLLPGILSHLKRIGLASILVPLAVQCRLAEIRRLLFFSLLIAVAILYFGPPQWLNLPALDYSSPFVRIGRNVGILYNPNVLSYIAAIQTLLLIMYTQTEGSDVTRLAALIGIALSILTFGSGASRSATVGLIPALLYMIWMYRSPGMFFVLWVGAIPIMCSTAIDSFRASFSESAFAARWAHFLHWGAQEQNLATRMSLQWQALLRSVWVPCGTGIGTVFTDSLFLDYLGSTGLAGLASILLMLKKCWQAQKTPTPEATAARAILICTSLISAGSLGIASNFVSPLFFLAVGLGMSPSLKALAASESGISGATDVAPVPPISKASPMGERYAENRLFHDL